MNIKVFIVLISTVTMVLCDNECTCKGSKGPKQKPPFCIDPVFYFRFCSVTDNYQSVKMCVNEEFTAHLSRKGQWRRFRKAVTEYILGKNLTQVVRYIDYYSGNEEHLSRENLI